jgi:NAD(P)-dependent dehydrogenase (short-subunit alcohol dehydrogenase family)
MMKRNFFDKVVAITGAASGIGLAAAWKFASAGAKIGLLDMDQEALLACEKDFLNAGYDVLAVLCDVTRQEDCETAVSKIIAHYGGIDVLFNNAGITQRGTFVNTRISVYRKVMEVNFFGSLYCTKAAINSLIERQGLIIVNESVAGLTPLLGRTGYSASKHAMQGLFTSLRCELREKGVHVLIVCPGFIKTNLQTRALGSNGNIAIHPQSTIGKQDTPEHAAEIIFAGAEKGKHLLVLTVMGKIGYWVSRLAPVFYEKMMTRKFQSELGQ